jgi:hypothetical protein
MTGRSGAGVCRCETEEEAILLISCSRQIFLQLICVKDCIGRNYIGEQIHICSDSQAVLQTLEASRIISRLVSESPETICALRKQNKEYSGHSGIQ